MEKLPCPGCRTLLNMEDTACPICLRPRSKYEITRAYAQLREEKARRRRRPFIVLGVLLAVGAAGRGIYVYREPIGAAAQEASARVQRFIAEQEDPKHLAAHPLSRDAAEVPVPAPPEPSATVSTPAPTAATKPALAAPAFPGARPRPAPERRAALPEPEAPALGTLQWGLYGRAYDLATLAPAGNVALSFQLPYGSQSTNTDATGCYKIALPRGMNGEAPDVDVATLDSRYAPLVLHEPDIPYLRLPKSEREELVQSALTGDVHSTPVGDDGSGQARRLDVFLAPRR